LLILLVVQGLNFVVLPVASYNNFEICKFLRWICAGLAHLGYRFWENLKDPECY